MRMRPEQSLSTTQLAWLMSLAAFLVPSTAVADSPRVLPAGQRPADERLKALKDLDGHFPFQVPKTAAAWDKRAEELRRRVRVATGLWPLPPKTPLNPVIHGQVQRDGFTVEKVYFESVPDHFVTGLLFRPVGRAGKRPGVLCPHGHGGRLQDYGEEAILELITQGAERFVDCGRYPKLSRCAQLARMGCVTFIFDMVGYADSRQLSRELAHRFRNQRPELDDPDRWGFYSTQAELRLQSIMGLQTWNSVRALDFLTSLPDVDSERIGVTGGSGGGTQTILLGAIDQRPIAAFPQGMVSTSMQGGCTCENCCLLRVGTGNVELAAIFAPRPQAMTAADDWTEAMMQDGFPQLQQLYRMLGHPDHVACFDLTHFPHNYNYVTRAIMYEWFNRHLQLGLAEPIVEEHWEPLTPDEYTVWNQEHPAPEGGLDHELKLTRWLADVSDEQITKLIPSDRESLGAFRETIGGAIRTLIGRELLSHQQVEREKVEKANRSDYLLFKDLVRVPGEGEELPVLSFYPVAADWNDEVVIWIDGGGKSTTLDSMGKPISAIRTLLDSGFAVVSADLFLQGEFADGGRVESTRVVENPREFAGFTFGYNHTLLARRAHDVLTLISFVDDEEHAPEAIHLVGLNGAGPVVAAARSIAGVKIDRMAIDTEGFRFRSLNSYRDPKFLPGAVKYGDLPAFIALAAPHPVWIAGEGGATPEWVTAAYRAAAAPQPVSVDTTGKAAPLQAAEWIANP